MVRKVIIFISILAVILAVPISASADSYYTNDAPIPSDILTTFRDVIDNEVGLNQDYILTSESGDTYYLFVSDSFSHYIDEYDYYNYFYGYDVQIYRYRLINTGQTEYVSFSNFTDENVEIVCSENCFIYSNLSGFPDLIERSSYYAFASFILLCVALCIYLVHNIFRYCFRR